MPKLFNGNCKACQVGMRTYYSGEKKEIVMFNLVVVVVKDDCIIEKAFRFQNSVEDCRGRALARQD